MEKRKLLLGLFFMVTSVMFLYSQDWERVTYLEIRSDGSRGNTRTVDAMFFASIQMEIVLEGNNLAIYQSVNYNGEWSDWELTQRQPMRGTIREHHDAFRRDYELYPNWGTVFQWGGVNVLRMLDIPRGKSSPIWWSTTGNSYFAFYKVYIIR